VCNVLAGDFRTSPARLISLFSTTPHIVGKLWRVFYSLTLAPGSGNLLNNFIPCPGCPLPPALRRDLGSWPPPSTTHQLAAFASIDQQQFVVQFAANLASHAGRQQKERSAGVERMQGCSSMCPGFCVLSSLRRLMSAVCHLLTLWPVCMSRVLLYARVQKCPGNCADRQQGQCVLIIVVIISWACSEREANVNIIKIKAVKWTNWVESGGRRRRRRRWRLPFLLSF